MQTTGQLFSDSAPRGAGVGQPTFAELYERILVGPLFQPWAEELLARVTLARGAHVLDVACGTGIVARLARERVGAEGRIVGVDRSPLMLAVAREIDPATEWLEGDAAPLPSSAGSGFDAVFCHQGLQFFPDRPAAVHAMREALKPGGRVVIGVWRELAENGVFHRLDLIGERMVGSFDDPRHSFPDAGALAKLLMDAGFVSVRVEPVTRPIRIEALPLVQMNSNAVVAFAAARREIPEQERQALIAKIVDESIAELAPQIEDGYITSATSANIGVGYV